MNRAITSGRCDVLEAVTLQTLGGARARGFGSLRATFTIPLFLRVTAGSARHRGPSAKDLCLIAAPCAQPSSHRQSTPESSRSRAPVSSHAANLVFQDEMEEAVPLLPCISLPPSRFVSLSATLFLARQGSRPSAALPCTDLIRCRLCRLRKSYFPVTIFQPIRIESGFEVDPFTVTEAPWEFHGSRSL